MAWGTFLIAFWTMIPQIQSIRRYAGLPGALEGVSMISLVVIAVDYVLWTVYGWHTGAWAIWIPSLFGVFATAVTIVMLVRVRRHSSTARKRKRERERIRHE